MQTAMATNNQSVVANTTAKNEVATNQTNDQAQPTVTTETPVKTGWQQAADKSWTYYNNDGKANTGREYSLMPTIGDTNGKSKSWYLMQDGKALSGVQEWAGSYWDFDSSSYTLSQKKDYFQSQWGLWYFKDDTGRIQSGVQEWAGSYWYFDPMYYTLSQKKDYVQSQWGAYYLVGNDGRIQSGVQEWAGSYWYFDPTTYLLSQKKNYVQSQWGAWYMVGNDGRIQSGLVDWMGSTYYFDPVTYLRTDNKDFYLNGVKYHADKNGIVTNDGLSAKVNKALSAIGTPYVWGGSQPGGFDCSGLVQWAYGLPQRTTYTQQTVGKHVYNNVANAPYGALLFFGSDASPSHVAISLGNGTYVHAPEPGDVVKIASQKYFAPNYYVVVGQY
ncbi:C40 family peptidase [Limosilactobacillus equigenerosi]|nr:C40 family peptidase [Limosilactobacillus equigenerosi]